MNTIATQPFAALLSHPDLRESLRIKDISIEPITAELTAPFPIASDTSTHAERVNNVLVRMTLDDGTVGLGEAAPFKGISGDTQELLLKDLEPVTTELVGAAFNVFEIEEFGNTALGFPAARAALEMAFLDALARKKDLWLSTFLHPHTMAGSFETDVTIPLVNLRDTARLAVRYVDGGFTRIKIKVGKNLKADLLRVEAVRQVFQDAGRSKKLEMLADANEGYTLCDAKAFVRKCMSANSKDVKIFEQPVKRSALDDLVAVTNLARIFNIKVYADESVYTEEHAARLVERGAVDGFNLKLMKHGGFLEALRIADLAVKHGLGLMIGGMIETRLAMTASLHLARIIGGDHLKWLDLDTPLLLHDDHLFTGGIQYAGPRMQFPDYPAAGVSVKLR